MDGVRFSFIASIHFLCRRKLTLLLVTSVLFTTGCAHLREWHKNGYKVGPNYGRPDTDVACDWIDTQNTKLIRNQAVNSEWWASFNDPVLNELILEGYEQNLTLKQAGTRILEARAIRGIAVGGLFPQTQRAFADYSHNLRSTQGVNIPTPTRNFSIWDGGLNMAWEIDFWGRYRRQIEAADAELDVSIENYDDAIVTLLSEIASAYIEIRTAQTRLSFAKANVTALGGSLEIADIRFKNGAAPELDVFQSRTILSQTEALIPTLEIDLRRANNRLCVLLGRPPEDLVVQLPPAELPKPRAEVAVGLPANLLRQRPDVRSAERSLAAQCARIGVAESEFYPHLTINGTVGVQAQQFNGLFQNGSGFGSVGPSINWNIFNYGRLRNAVTVQDARFQQLALAYQQKIFTANQEVEDAIVGYYRNRERVAALQRGVEAAVKSSELTLILYREGKGDYNRVYNVLSTQVIQQDLLAQAMGDVNLDLIQLYRALGGGWEIRTTHDGPCTWCDGCECIKMSCCDDYCKKPCPPCPPEGDCLNFGAPLPPAPPAVGNPPPAPQTAPKEIIPKPN